MMKNKLFSILIFLVLVFSMELQAQPSWHFNNTGNNHTILIQNSIEISVDGIQVLPGDYIGVFYDSLGSLACGGYMQWQGNTSTLAAWGAQSGNVDGFAQGEEFTWKIWIASNQSEFLSTVIYISGMFPNQGNFTVNGMSGLQSLLATSPQPPSPGWYYENTPLVHSIIIPDTISILLNGNPIVSGDYLGVFYDSLGTQACGGYLCRTGQTDTLLAYGQTSGNNAFSAGEEFSWKIWRASNEVSAWANVNYYTQNISDSAFFINGGLSQLATLSAISGKDLGITDLLWPQNSCSNLGSNESLELEFTNFGYGSLFNFNLEVHINESW
ncbi:MAG: hypothetical protein U9R19_06730, partial [Bacteroidota bacterium]|nr:hypothetical protein [Bacteroidota bacterium]